MSPLKPLSQLLKENTGELHGLLAHAARLERATRLLLAALDPPLNQHCRVANIKDSVLVVQADSSAWASKLRFRVAAVLACVQREPGFEKLRAVRVKVRK